MNNRFKSHKKIYDKGFSLIELIIVVAILAILLGIISPLYLRWVEKSRETADITNMKTVETAALCLYLDGELTTEPNKSYYDSASGTIIDEVPKSGYGKGTTSNRGTSYTPNSCSDCTYDPGNSYVGAYLNVYYDEKGRFIHTHWIDSYNNIITGPTQIVTRGKHLADVIAEAFSKEVIGTYNGEVNKNQIDSPAIGYGKKITNYINAMKAVGLELPEDEDYYWAYKQAVEGGKVKSYCLVWSEEDIQSKALSDTVKVIQYNSATGKYSVGCSNLKSSSVTQPLDGKDKISYNTVYDAFNITAVYTTDNLDDALKKYEKYLTEQQ